MNTEWVSGSLKDFLFFVFRLFLFFFCLEFLWNKIKMRAKTENKSNRYVLTPKKSCHLQLSLCSCSNFEIAYERQVLCSPSNTNTNPYQYTVSVYYFAILTATHRERVRESEKENTVFAFWLSFATLFFTFFIHPAVYYAGVTNRCRDCRYIWLRQKRYVFFLIFFFRFRKKKDKYVGRERVCVYKNMYKR